jgi:hypothetical protein
VRGRRGLDFFSGACPQLCHMQTALSANPAADAEAIRLEALLKRIVSGEVALPCSAHQLSLPAKVDFGTMDPDMLAAQHPQQPVQLLNSSSNPVTVTRLDLLPSTEVFAVYSDSSLMHPLTFPAIIPAQSSLSFVLCFRATSYPGRLSCRLVVSALTQPLSLGLELAWRAFVIGCACTAVIRNPLVDDSADVDAKAFVPAAIRSIFDRASPSYCVHPPTRAAPLQLVCCFCHDSAASQWQIQQKTKGSKKLAAKRVIDAGFHFSTETVIPSAESDPNHCKCSFHLDCLQRWAVIAWQDLNLLLPCPSCGLTIRQLHAQLSSLAPTTAAAISAASTIMQHMAFADTGSSQASSHSEIKAEADSRAAFGRHMRNLVDASKAEFFARLEEMRGFAAFDVEFREIETGFKDHVEPPTTLLSLTLPGVPENCPKVHLGQTLRLRFSSRGLPAPPETVHGAEFVCHVVKVRGSEVVVACHPAMRIVLHHHRFDPLNLHVCFCMDLFTLSQDFRLLIFGLKLQYIRPLLFPHDASASSAKAATAVGIFDARLSAAQLQSIACALQSAAADDAVACPPHIICGPPGTGKTSVLAEIILQAWQLNQQAGSGGVILVTAPSPDAADVLALRLRDHLSPDHMLLVCSCRRSVDTLRPGLRDYVNIITTEGFGIPLDVFAMPPAASLRSCGVIVASSSACAELLVALADGGKHTELHVSLVVVDEAAQATEVDSLKALTFAGSRTRVLLAGDHMQLGPIVASRRALDLQFHVSLMQRLVALDVYRQPGMCSCLSVNYRSHPALIAVPSFLFYANSIRCAAQAAPVGDAGALLCDWPGLPRRDFPLMFYGVAGVDSSPDGHGVRNSAEAKSVLFLVSKLLEDVPTLSQSDIGVMAPFRLQVPLPTARPCHASSPLAPGAARALHVSQRKSSRRQGWHRGRLSGAGGQGHIFVGYSEPSLRVRGLERGGGGGVFYRQSPAV